MKISPDDDGEYTDAESPAAAATKHDNETQAESEYADGDTPEQNPTGTDSPGR